MGVVEVVLRSGDDVVGVVGVVGVAAIIVVVRVCYDVVFKFLCVIVEMNDGEWIVRICGCVIIDVFCD